MRRFLILLAFIGCARSLPAARTTDPSPDPLIIGRSPQESTATDGPTDAGAVVTWGMPSTGDAAAVGTGCHVEAKGYRGGITIEYACIVEQEADRHSFDGGVPFLGIWSRRTDPTLRIVILRGAVPVVGVQPSGSFTAVARVGAWGAETQAAFGTIFSGSTTGKFTLTLTSVRAVRDSGLGAYELHGTVDAQLVPDWNSGAVGWIDLHAEF